MSAPRRRNTTGARLRAAWDRRRGDLVYRWDAGAADAHLLSAFLCHLKWPDDRTLLEELAARGYDLTTLRLSVRKKVPPP